MHSRFVDVMHMRILGEHKFITAQVVESCHGVACSEEL